MSDKILTENGLVDEGAWDKIKQFTQRPQPNLRTAYLQNFNKPSPQAQPVQTPAPQAQPPIIKPQIQQQYKGPVPPVMPQAAPQAPVSPVIPTKGTKQTKKVPTTKKPTATPMPPASSKSPEKSETGAFKLQEDFITKKQLKTLIKSVASVLKESQ
jgi:hypothetical protein